MPLRSGAASVLMAAALACASAPDPALAWGATGHRIIGRLAIQTLPPDLPAFIRSPAAAEAVGELAREPDRWKGSGRSHDTDLDPGHFLDMGDDGKVLGGPAVADLPATREGYDTALRAVGADSWRAGFLPYSITDGWQQLIKDFAYWRADEAGARLSADPAHRAWLTADGARRQALILRDVGVLGHYVGDGSQPLHVSQHFNGWGDYPNPRGFTQERVHAYFEGAFVRQFVETSAARADMAPYKPCAGPILTCVETYLTVTNAQVVPFYELEKAGGFKDGDARGRAFAEARLAAGAAELRDIIAQAWTASARAEVGYPPVKVADVEEGKIDPYEFLYGLD